MKRVFQLLAFASLAVSAFAGLPQAIAPVDIVVKAPDASSFSLPATSSAGLPITWSALAGPASVTGVTVSMTGGTGAVTLRGSQSGDATFDPAADRYVTFVVETGGGFLSVSAGEAHVAGIKADGKIYAWGRNTNGQLGDGTTTDRSTPAVIVVSGTATWSTVACGSNHTIARRSDGTLWAWGSNASGQLGISSTTDAPFPTKIGTATNWAGVACGANHTVAWRSDGSLYAWGLNSQGQVGDNTVGNIRTSPVRIGAANDWSEVSCGAQHTLGRRAGGSLWAWGNNTYGQLGDGTNTRRTAPFRIGTGSDWIGVGAGLFFSTGRRTGNTLWTWGNNDSGQLGDGTRVGQTAPQQVGTGTNWTTVTCGTAFVIGRRSDGFLWAWGDNAAGQLGDGTTTDQLQPTQTLAGPWTSVAAGSACALGVRNQSLWSWGTNDYQQLALPPSVTGFSAVPPAARIPYPVPQAAVALPSAVLPTATLTPAVASALPPVLRIVSGPAVLSPDSRSVSFTAEGLARIEVAQAGDAAWEPAATQIFEVQVDGTGPVFSPAPASFTAQAPSAAGVVVTFSPTATDAVSGPATVVCLPASGSVFPVGSTQVTCTAIDALGNTTTAQFTVFVNQSPAFSGYSLSTPKSTAVTLTLTKLLGRVTDPDGGVPALVGFSPGSSQGGTVSLASGLITYTPVRNFAGTDTFTVTFSDGQGGSTLGTVTVFVAPGSVNVPEVAIQSGNLANVVFRGIPNQTYVIQKSFNLTTWSDVDSVVATSNGTVLWSDPTPVTGPVFWRLAVPE